MPNHVVNRINLEGDKEKIAEMLNAIKSEDYGIGSIDFNKIIPMPESLNIECGSSTDKGLKAYKEFLDICTFGGANPDMDLLNIPEEKEKIFLRMCKDIKPKEWELGRQAFRNEKMYGATTWYEWSINNWGTKWNAYGYSEGVDYSEADELYCQTAYAWFFFLPLYSIIIASAKPIDPALRSLAIRVSALIDNAPTFSANTSSFKWSLYTTTSFATALRMLPEKEFISPSQAPITRRRTRLYLYLLRSNSALILSRTFCLAALRCIFHIWCSLTFIYIEIHKSPLRTKVNSFLEVRNMFFKVILVFGLVEIPNVYTNLIRMCRVWVLFADGC